METVLSWLSGIQIVSGILTLLSTLVVVVGLICEYLGSKSTNRTDWNPWLGPPKYWDTERIGDFLIVIGVAGELLFGFIAFISTSMLDTKRQSQIAELSRQTEKANSANVQLERLLLPRHVTMDFMGREFKTVSQFAGINIQVFTVPDLEAVRLAADIRGLLDACGWSGKGNVTVLPLESSLRVPDGVRIIFPLELKTQGQKGQPDFSTPQSKAANALSQYLTFGYLWDLSSRSTSGIENRAESFSVGSNWPQNIRPKWWSADYNPSSDMICVFVGMKPTVSGIEHINWLNELPDKARRWFQSQEQLFIVPGMGDEP